MQTHCSRFGRATLVTLAVAAVGLAPALAAAHDETAHRSALRARERLDGLLRDPPSAPGPFHSAGMRLLRAGDHEGAAIAFGEAARRSTNPANAHYNRACALALGGSIDAAFAALRTALDAGYDDPGHLAEDEDLERLHGDPRFDALLAEAEALEMPPVNPGRAGWWWGDRSERESRQAATRLWAWLEGHPQSGRAAYGLGIAYLNLGDHDGSSRAFQRALQLGYREAATLYNLACVEARRGQLDAAFAYLDRALDAGFHEARQLRSDDDLDALRGDPRYRAAVRKADQLARSHGETWHGWDGSWDEVEEED